MISVPSVMDVIDWDPEATAEEYRQTAEGYRWLAARLDDLANEMDAEKEDTEQ